jgi:hypothetical protein
MAQAVEEPQQQQQKSGEADYQQRYGPQAQQRPQQRYGPQAQQRAPTTVSAPVQQGGRSYPMYRGQTAQQQRWGKPLNIPG